MSTRLVVGPPPVSGSEPAEGMNWIIKSTSVWPAGCLPGNLTVSAWGPCSVCARDRRCFPFEPAVWTLPLRLLPSALHATLCRASASSRSPASGS